jgi:hypothetical protein
MAAFEPEVLVIANDSWKHSSHAAMRELRGRRVSNFASVISTPVPKAITITKVS